MSSIHSILESPDIDDKYDELQLLFDSDRSVLQLTDSYGSLPIHTALANPHITLRIIQLLLNGWPESVSQPFDGDLPIHYLCKNVDLDEAVSVQILALLVKEHPESVHREASLDDGLPVHTAASLSKSPEFLKILINAHPESVRIPYGINRVLPIHLACDSDNCRLDSVKYLLGIYPGSINSGDDSGFLPIHCAASSYGPQKADVIEHLLSKDPTCATKVTEHGEYPLHWACSIGVVDLNALHLLFNAYPEAILKRDNERKTPLDRVREYRAEDYMEDTNAYEEVAAELITFLETQLSYAEKAQDVNVMTTLDQKGWLPLHRALKDNALLGSIKLLIKGFPQGLQAVDRNIAFPLHIACEYSTKEVVQYLMKVSDERNWKHLDVNKDSILHYACRGGDCEVVKYLLDKQSRHVSKHNADNKLPIHLLCQFGLPANSLEHTDTIYRLLLAYPETL